MKGKKLGVMSVGLLVVLSAGPVSAQQPPKAKPARTGAVTWKDLSKQATLETAEDMEIMGRILREAMAEVYPSRESRAHAGMMGAGMTGMSSGAYGMGEMEGAMGRSARQEVPQIAGPLSTYLPGHGVVYQVAVPPLPTSDGVAATALPDREQPPSAWERTVRELKGVPAKAQTAEKERRDPTIDDLAGILLNAFAENGHNFRHLKDDERVTVAVMFQLQESRPGRANKARPAFRSLPQLEKRQDTGYPGSLPGPPNSGYGSGSSGAGEYMSGGGGPGARSSYMGDSGEGYGTSDEESSAESSGDLHMRRGDYEKALEAYEEARRQQAESSFNKVSDSVSPAFLEKSNRLLRKLIQAHVGAGNLQKAKELLAVHSEKQDERKNGSKKSKALKQSKREPSIPIPARLIVSVTKADLDAVAAGNLKRGELHNRADINYFDPRALRNDTSEQEDK